MERTKHLQLTGHTAFFLSGVCAISSGVIVSILQEIYGFSYSVTGTLLACMNIGNMLASFASGILPAKIGTRKTVAVLCIGYFLGYMVMTVSGALGILMSAFAMVGLAKGCTINNCTVLVGNNSRNRTRGMNIMHACYACGALLCPFLITAMSTMGQKLPSKAVGQKLPMLGIAVVGSGLWLVFLTAGLPGKPEKGKTKEKLQLEFLKSKEFWLITGLLFCQNAAETSVTGWLVTYYKGQGILSGVLNTYTVTIMWGATLIARLLIAFVFPIKNTFRALAVMGAGCTALYGVMMFTEHPIGAVCMLFLFAFSMAGVNPVAVAGTGKMMSATSMGVMLPMAGLGAILMPWIIGLVADAVSLQAGMICNLVPCTGILVLSVVISGMRKKSDC